MAKFRIVVGTNYPDPDGKGEKRAEPGDIVDDLPEKSVKALLERGFIEPVRGGKPTTGGEE